MQKSLYAFIAIGGLLMISAMLYFGVHSLSGKYLDSQKSTPNIVACTGEHRQHNIEIKNNLASPAYVYASLCDRLTITNRDNRIRLIAFGEHDRHQAYGGVSEKALKKGESLDLQLNQAGIFLYHDHFQESAKGSFSVVN